MNYAPPKNNKRKWLKNKRQIDNGIIIFQDNDINWSYLYLGKVALTQINKNTIKINLLKNQNQPGTKYNKVMFKGGNHPPKKRHTVKLDINKIEEYSAKKNKTKPTAEYSTLYPETSSDSASGKSKGTRFVSAKIDMKNNIKDGNSGII